VDVQSAVKNESDPVAVSDSESMTQPTSEMLPGSPATAPTNQAAKFASVSIF
jgi:hypothetical protein